MKTYEDNFADHPKNLYPDLTQVLSPDGYYTSPTSPSPQEKFRNRASTLPSDDTTSQEQLEKQCNHTSPNDDICSSDDPKCVTFSCTGEASLRNSGSLKDDNNEKFSSSEKNRASPIMTLSSSLPYWEESPNDNDSERELTRYRSFQPTPPVRHLVEGIVC